MTTWLRVHHGWITNLIAIAAPVVAGVLSGGVFTLPVLVAALGSLAGKLAQTPLAPPISQATAEVIRAVAKANKAP